MSGAGTPLPDEKFEVWKYNKLMPRKRRTVVIDDSAKELYCVDGKGTRKPVLPLTQLVTTHSDGLRMDLHFSGGLKVYKFDLADAREMDRMWLALQRYCSEPGAPPEHGAGAPALKSRAGSMLTRLAGGRTSSVSSDASGFGAGGRGSISSLGGDELGRVRGRSHARSLATALSVESLPAPPNSVAEFLVVKLTKYSAPHNRILSLNPVDKSLCTLEPTTGGVAKEFMFTVLKGCKRSVANPRRLLLEFSDTRDYTVQFASSHERESFCALLRAVHPRASYTWDGERREGEFGMIYDVNVVVASGLRKKRVLLVQRDRRTVARLRSATDAAKLVKGDAAWETFVAKGDEAGKAAAAGPADAVISEDWSGSSSKKVRRLQLTRKHGKPPRRVDHRLSVEAHPTDKRRLKMKFETGADDDAAGAGAASGASAGSGTGSAGSKKGVKDEWLSTDIIFGSPDQRERCAGQLRAFHAEATAIHDSPADKILAGGVELYTVTWNVGEKKPPPPDKLGVLVPPGRHLYAIGLQECEHRADWIKAITAQLGAGFGTVAVVSLWGIHLIVMAAKTLLPRISHVHTSSEATGLGNILGNKGGVAVGLTLQEDTRLCFITAHLAARVTRVVQRGQNYMQIIRKLRLGQPRGLEILHHFHHVFWLGDLNYRVDRGHHGTVEEYNDTVAKAESGNVDPLLSFDQLKEQQALDKVFFQFQEAPITFAPTYRMLKGQLGYSNKKFQNPSWTDRVLWRSHPGVESHVVNLEYGAWHELITSDHRPVYGLFSLLMQPNYCITPPPPQSLKAAAAAVAKVDDDAAADNARRASTKSRQMKAMQQEAGARNAGKARRFSMTTQTGAVVDELSESSFQAVRIGFTHLHFELKPQVDAIALMENEVGGGVVDEWGEVADDKGHADAGGAVTPKPDGDAAGDDDDDDDDEFAQSAPRARHSSNIADADATAPARKASSGDKANDDAADGDGEDDSDDDDEDKPANEKVILKEMLSHRLSSRNPSAALPTTNGSKVGGASSGARAPADGESKGAPVPVVPVESSVVAAAVAATAEAGAGGSDAAAEDGLDPALIVQAAHAAWEGARISVAVTADFTEHTEYSDVSLVRLGDPPVHADGIIHDLPRPNECFWGSEQLPLLTPFIPDIRHLFTKDISVAVRRQVGALGQWKTVGQAELSLHSLAPMTQPEPPLDDPDAGEHHGSEVNSLYSQPFSVPVVLSGRPAGHLSGRVVMYNLDRAATASRRLAALYKRNRMAAPRRASVVAPGKDAARFPPAQIGMSDDVRHTLLRRLVRVWRSDTKALVPTLNHAQLVFLANQFDGGFDMGDRLALVKKSVEDGLATGSASLLLDFGPEEESTHVWELVWRFHMLRCELEEASDATSADEDEARFTLFLNDYLIDGLRASEEPLLDAIADGDTGLVSIMTAKTELYMSGSDVVKWLMDHSEETAAADRATALRILRRLVQLRVLWQADVVDGAAKASDPGAAAGAAAAAEVAAAEAATAGAGAEGDAGGGGDAGADEDGLATRSYLLNPAIVGMGRAAIDQSASLATMHEEGEDVAEPPSPTGTGTPGDAPAASPTAAAAASGDAEAGATAKRRLSTHPSVSSLGSGRRRTLPRLGSLRLNTGSTRTAVINPLAALDEGGDNGNVEGDGDSASAASADGGDGGDTAEPRSVKVVV